MTPDNKRDDCREKDAAVEGTEETLGSHLSQAEAVEEAEPPMATP